MPRPARSVSAAPSPVEPPPAEPAGTAPGAARPPSIERLLAAARPALGEREHEAVLTAAREVVARERGRLASGGGAQTLEALADELVERLDAFAVPVATGPGAGTGTEAGRGVWAHEGAGTGPATVLNATGVIVHTNLGRAPWPAAAIEAARAAAGEYLLLEMDRASGRRGARFRVAEEHLIALTGAEDALVTNNNAAALALAVGLAGRGGGVVVSRGELVEIGGGVRIPEIIRRAGARLIEVGTTNRTRVADFTAPVKEGRAKLVLRVHPSNFRQEGFVEAPDAEALAELAHRHGVLLVDDLGSGALLPTERFGLAHEPMPSERLAAGADLVTFSGDKLVGGPQAGLIVGRADLVAKVRRDPLARATRPDKVTLAALAATLGLYRAGLAAREIPVWRMIATRPGDLRARAEALAEALAARLDGSATGVRAVALASTVGGGSLPGETLPSWGLALGGASASSAGSTFRVGSTSRVGAADALLARLRLGDPAVIGRIEDGRVLLDLRTVDRAHDAALLRAVVAALAA